MTTKPTATAPQEAAMRALAQAVTTYLNAVGAGFPDELRALIAGQINRGAVRLALAIQTAPFRADVFLVRDGDEPVTIHTSGVEAAETELQA